MKKTYLLYFANPEEINCKRIIFLVIMLYFFAVIAAPLFHYYSNKNLTKNNFIFSAKNFSVLLNTGSHIVSYISGTERLSQHTDNKVTQHIYATNRHKSVLKLSTGENNANGIEYKYNAYGEITNAKKNNVNYISNPFLFNGERFSLHTKLQYLKARFYYPHLTSFINQDSARLLNRFNYADDNPVMKYDPTGHAAEKIFRFLIGNILPALALSEFLPIMGVEMGIEMVTSFMSGYFIPTLLTTNFSAAKKALFFARKHFLCAYDKIQIFFLGGIFGAISGAAIAAVANGILILSMHKKINSKEWLKSLIIGGALGAFVGSLGKFIRYRAALKNSPELTLPLETVAEDAKEDVNFFDKLLNDLDLINDGSSQGLSSTDSLVSQNSP